MGNDPIQKAAPRPLYYLAIDGTSAIDSVAYGELLEGQKDGWRNLVADFLSPAADDPKRLHCPNHPFLPICLYDAKTPSKSVAVVCPNGRESIGKDPFWRTYAGETEAEKPNGKFEWGPNDAGTTFGRWTAFRKSTLTVGELIRNPSIEVVEKNGQQEKRLLDVRLLPDTRELGNEIHADLLIVSSHGWLGGYMAGNTVSEWPEAEPAEARPATMMGVYFLVGEAAVKGRGFHGPQWILLAQCSTLNRATWPLWAKVLQNSSPSVRGILAYEEVSPGAAGSIPIAKAFIANCKTMSILQAWKTANSGEKWAAMVNRDAVDDRMANWRNFKEPASITTTEKTASYLGFLRSTPEKGEEILDVPPPFTFELFSAFPITAELTDPKLEWDQVTPDLLNRNRAMFKGDRFQRVRAVAPKGAKITGMTIQWIHIRPTYRKQFPVSTLFTGLQPMPKDKGKVTVAVKADNKKLIEILPVGGPVDAIEGAFADESSAALAKSGMEQHHSYVWPRVVVSLDDGRNLSHDFMTTGLSYVG